MPPRLRTQCADKSVHAARSRCRLTTGKDPCRPETGRRFPNAPRRRRTRPISRTPFGFSSVSRAAISGARAPARSRSSKDGLNPNSEAGSRVAATPRRRKVLVPLGAGSPVGLPAFPVGGKMRRGRRSHPAATRRRRYPPAATSAFGLKRMIAELDRLEARPTTARQSLPRTGIFPIHCGSSDFA